MLGQLNIYGMDKVEVSIERFKAFEPEEGYFLAFSGGKDSCVIKALAERPTESDFISKAKVLETYSELYWFDSDCEVVSKAEVDKIYERLQSLPSADRRTVDKEYLIDLIQEAVYDGEACAKLIDLVDRPTGEWIRSHLLPNGWHCSNCDAPVMTDDIDEMLFCPNCGAKMRGIKSVNY